MQTQKPEASADLIELFVSGLPTSNTKKYLKKLLKKYDCEFFEPQNAAGVAVVKTASHKAARRILRLDGAEYKAHTLHIHKLADVLAVKKQPKQGAKAVLVSNLSPSTTKTQLESFFSGCGKVKAVRTPAGQQTSRRVEFFNAFAPTPIRIFSANSKATAAGVDRIRTQNSSPP